MKTIFVCSTVDPASENIYRNLADLNFEANVLDASNEFELVQVDRELPFVTHSELPSADAYIFLSRHSGSRPCFTLHATGNPTEKNELGGSPKKLGVASPSLAHLMLDALSRESPLPVVMEATHHGPTDFSQPILFVEVGASLENWQKRELGEFVAKAVVNAFTTAHKLKETNLKFACCFGGPHYSSQFTDYARQNSVGIGHILSKYSIGDENLEIIYEAVERSLPRPTCALVDWKGLKGKYKKIITQTMQEMRLNVLKI
jgi:D-aminoacyl-tRNA deacylase